MKILAVDDDQDILTVIDHTLRVSAHHEVTTASSAKDALKKMHGAENSFDCFLIDIQMPKVDGIDLTRLIRKTPGYERHPVVMLTAMHEKPYLDMAFQAGATDYLTKPFNFRELRNRIFGARRLTQIKNETFSEDYGSRNISWVRGEAKDHDPDLLTKSDDVEALISYAEFENYVLEIARRYTSVAAQRRHCNAAIIALKLADPMKQRSETSAQEFRAALLDVASAASARLKPVLSAISYRGNGTFLCVLERHISETSEYIQRELNIHLQRSNEKAEGAGMTLFVGDQVPLRTASNSAVLDILWLATDSVDQKFSSNRDAH